MLRTIMLSYSALNTRKIVAIQHIRITTRIVWQFSYNISMIRFILYNASIIRLAPKFKIGNEKHTFRMISIHNTHPHLLSSKT